MSNRLLNMSIVMILAFAMLGGCKQTSKKLPILGESDIVERSEGSKIINDTIYHTILDFKFVDQDSTWVTNETFAKQIYVADFFFTSCPTICPVMKKQMLRVYEQYLDNPSVAILSHSIDPKHDSVAVLKSYSDALGVQSSKWHFVTGDKDIIFDLGEKSYMITAGEDASAPGGSIHSGAFLLVDPKRQIRGVYDGTIPEEVDKLIRDIAILLNEVNAVD